MAWLNDGEPMTWIPCSEKLPEESGYFLCTLVTDPKSKAKKYVEVDILRYRKVKGHEERRWESYFRCDKTLFLTEDNVLAWMPLPFPYKGKKED